MTMTEQEARKQFEDSTMRDRMHQAVRTMLKFAGDDPDREGLEDTPARVTRAFAEWFAGYGVNPRAILERTFEEVGGYDEMIVVRDIRFASHCEHHMVPILGVATVAYLPGNRIVGLSKLARVVDAYARRLQVQERMTAQIADVIDDVLAPKGVGVFVEAEHLCMSTRGVNQPRSMTTTSAVRGAFKAQPEVRAEFFALCGR